MTNSKNDTFLPEIENWLQTRRANEQKLEEAGVWNASQEHDACGCLLYTSPSPRDMRRSRMPSSA